MKWALLFSLTLGPPRGAGADKWFARDKFEHFAACAVIQSVGYGFARGHNDHVASLRIGAASAGIAGLAKELFDLRTKGHFSAKDLAWDGFGAGTAVVALNAVR